MSCNVKSGKALLFRRLALTSFARRREALGSPRDLVQWPVMQITPRFRSGYLDRASKRTKRHRSRQRTCTSRQHYYESRPSGHPILTQTRGKSIIMASRSRKRFPFPGKLGLLGGIQTRSVESVPQNDCVAVFVCDRPVKGRLLNEWSIICPRRRIDRHSQEHAISPHRFEESRGNR